MNARHAYRQINSSEVVENLKCDTWSVPQRCPQPKLKSALSPRSLRPTVRGMAGSRRARVSREETLRHTTPLPRPLCKALQRSERGVHVPEEWRGGGIRFHPFRRKWLCFPIREFISSSVGATSPEPRLSESGQQEGHSPPFGNTACLCEALGALGWGGETPTHLQGRGRSHIRIGPLDWVAFHAPTSWFEVERPAKSGLDAR